MTLVGQYQEALRLHPRREDETLPEYGCLIRSREEVECADYEAPAAPGPKDRDRVAVRLPTVRTCLGQHDGRAAAALREVPSAKLATTSQSVHPPQVVSGPILRKKVLDSICRSRQN
jgi:hypothetical protein